jgi:hypothetical protein
MAAEFLKPKGVDMENLDRRKMHDGQFWNPPMFQIFGGGSGAEKFKFGDNKMTLERGGPQTVRGRPI